MNAVWARRPIWAAMLILVATTLILLSPALRPGYVLLATDLPYRLDPLWQPLTPPGAAEGANPVLGDQFYQYHAWKTALRQMLVQGNLSWWSPAINGGQPLLANGQVGLFDPFNWAELLFPLPAPYVVGALLRLWLAGVFTYAYARAIGLSSLPAILSMLAFTYSGPMLSWLGATPSHIFAWLPALFWVGEKLLTRRTLQWALVAAILLALLIFSSQPEIAFQVGLAWSLYLLVRAAWLEGGLWAAMRHHAPLWLLIAVLGMALAAVEILPFIDALRHSDILAHRATSPPLDLSIQLRRALFSWQEWPTLVTTLLPNFLGREVDESYWYPTGNSIENNAYAGVLPLLLALLALWRVWRVTHVPERARLWLWGGLGGGALALAVGLPLFQTLNDVPPLNLVAPGRFRGIYVFAVAILAGFGLDMLLAQTRLRRPLMLLLAAAALVNLLLVFTAYTGFSYFASQLIASGRAFMEANVGSPMLDRPLDELYALVETRQQAKLAMLHPANAMMYLPLLLALAVAMILWLQKQGILGQSLFAPLLVALAGLDLLWVGAGLNVARPAAWLEPLPAAIAYLQRQPQFFRVTGTNLILNPNMSILVQLEDVRGYDPLTTSRYRALLAGLDGFAPSGYHNYFRHLDDPRLDRLNAVYALSRTPPHDRRWQEVFTEPGGVTVYRSATALPRAYLVYAAEVVAGPEQSLARALAPAFDAQHSVVLEETPAHWIPSPDPPAAEGQLDLRRIRGAGLEITVSTALPAILVLLDSYAPGWHATLDRQPTPIYAANHAFRAVVVPAGDHTLVFDYRPPGLALGAAMSLAAGALIVVLFLWPRYQTLAQKPRPKDQPEARPEDHP